MRIVSYILCEQPRLPQQTAVPLSSEAPGPFAGEKPRQVGDITEKQGYEKMCSLLLGNNKPNPHSKWGNTPQKAENTPEQAPSGPFFDLRPEIPGKIGQTRLA